MKIHRALTVLALALVAVAACDRVSLPTSPSPPPTNPNPPPNASTGAVYGIVLEGSECLVGATVEMLDGPLAGERRQQTSTDCDSIYDASVHAFVFESLPLNSSVTLRASMAGYQSQTVTTKVIDCCFRHWTSSVRVLLKKEQS